ncbi:hypothetical protein Angca_003227, partial [Angiostrongylus cantonensis]
RAAWRAFKSIEDVVKRTKNIGLRAHLFDSAFLPAVTYASETWSLRISRFTRIRNGIRSPDLRQRSKIKDAVLYAKQSKIRWAGHVMRMNDNRWTRTVSAWISRDVKRTAGRPPTRWSE